MIAKCLLIYRHTPIVDNQTGSIMTMNLIISQTHNNNDTLTLFKVEMSNTQIAENLKHNYFLEVGKCFLSSNTNSISIITHRI